MLYWLYYYFNRHLGEWALDLQGTAPFYTPAAADGLSDQPAELAGPVTPALVTLSKDGKSLYLVVANGSWDTAVPCTLDVRHLRPVRATMPSITSAMAGAMSIQNPPKAIPQTAIDAT